MKLELSFGLDQAAWPALLVDRSGVIRRANQFAVTAFGPVVQGEAPLLGSLWAEGTGTVEEFLSRLD
ncbi:MAG TPA: hypothetical protein VHH73_00335, partial [Verrucomicrobiae bacterium]|nr:hypothetical protein [Verrucomicrobiae bacterium]